MNLLRRGGEFEMNSLGKKLSTLEDLVFNFRNAIEAAKANNEPGEFFRKFPVGQCGNTSDILAQYLLDNGFTSIIYENGTYYGSELDDRWSHTWLIVENLVIDITGDQFKYHSEPLKNNVPVYIGPMTDYYRLFEIGPGGSHEHFGLDGRWFNYRELKDWYNIILEYIE
jgi:hypothetical protein